MQENPTVWLFDLDNTLHNADAGLFTLINRAMTRYMTRPNPPRPTCVKTIGTATAQRSPDCKSTIPKSTSPNFCAKAIRLTRF